MYLTPKFDGIAAYGVSGVVGIPAAPIQVLTATGQIAEFVPNDGISLEEVSFLVTTSVSATSAPVISIYNRPVAGVSGAADVLLGTMTIPTGAVAGNLVYRKVSETSFTVAQRGSLVFVVTSVASSAGKGICSFKAGQTPEAIQNIASGLAVSS